MGQFSFRLATYRSKDADIILARALDVVVFTELPGNLSSIFASAIIVRRRL